MPHAPVAPATQGSIAGNPNAYYNKVRDDGLVPHHDRRLASRRRNVRTILARGESRSIASLRLTRPRHHPGRSK